MPMPEPLSSIILICIIFFSSVAFYWFNKPRKKVADVLEKQRKKDSEERQKIIKARMEAELKNVTCQK